MDITLFSFNTPVVRSGFSPHEKYLTQPPNLGIALLASILDSGGFDVTAIDGNQMFSNDFILDNFEHCCGKMLDEVFRTCPKILAISSWTVNQPFALEFAKSYRQKDHSCVIILGGFGPTFMPEKILEIAPQVDIVIIGSGENNFLELARKIKEGGKWKQVEGIGFRHDGRIVVNALSKNEESLDKLPFIHYKNFRFLNSDNNFSMMVSRGCVMKCSFCTQINFWKTYRTHSVGYVEKQIESLCREYGDIKMWFSDDDFLINYLYAAEISRLLRREKMVWGMQTRIDRLNESRIKGLKEDGCASMYIGVESIIPSSLKFMNKCSDAGAYIKATYDNLDAISRAGIYTMVSTIIGAPDELGSDIKKMEEFTIRCNGMESIFAYMGLIIPYPNTEISRRYKAGSIGLFRLNKSLRNGRSSFFNSKYDYDVDLVPNAYGIVSRTMSIPKFSEIAGTALMNVRKNRGPPVNPIVPKEAI